MLLRAFGPPGAPFPEAVDAAAALAAARRFEVSPRVAARQGRARLAEELGAETAAGFQRDLTTAAAPQITAVRLIRLGSVTHAFDMGTMAVSLDFTKGDGSISVTAPASSWIAPPGYYQVFVLNRNGVPSEGRTVRVQ